MAAVCPVVLAGCAVGGHVRTSTIAPGTRYVALGSSFAAGPGIIPPADKSPPRCARSSANYAHLLARALRLNLVDESCSGATTAHLLGPWGELPAQLDALTSDTVFITITIGGNDVGYIGNLGGASCRSFAKLPANVPGGKCPDRVPVTEAAWSDLAHSLRQIAAEAHRRAPAARLIFVDYLSVLPASGTCAATPLTADQAAAGRAVARRLALLTLQVARQEGAEVLPISEASKNHTACDHDPWVTGFPLPGATGFVPYHPNARGMAAIANKLARYLDISRHKSNFKINHART